ncbi:hypothetical protein HN011_000474 [Eciton burchellii]|nr:hypothetical protein HN011_000474 [Eciton burchellii]
MADIRDYCQDFAQERGLILAPLRTRGRRHRLSEKMRKYRCLKARRFDKDVCESGRGSGSIRDTAFIAIIRGTYERWYLEMVISSKRSRASYLDNRGYLCESAIPLIHAAYSQKKSPSHLGAFQFLTTCTAC